MKKILIYISTLLVAFTIGAGHGMAVEDMPSQNILQAAETGLATLVKDPRMKNLDRLGFGSQAMINDATLGRGLRIYTIPPQEILDEKAGFNLFSAAVPTTQWQFLVETQGKAISLLTVDRMGDQWQAVSIGSSELAKQLAKVLEAWPSSAGHEYRLIRIYQAKSDYLAISKNSEVMGIIPMISGQIAMGLMGGVLNTANLRSSEEIVENIRQTIRLNMQSR